MPGNWQRDYRSVPKCKGEGRILRQRSVDAKIPAGVEDGTRIRFTGGGEAGPVRRTSGRPLRGTAREGASIFCAGRERSALRRPAIGDASGHGRGDSRPHSGRRACNLKIPEGTQPGTTFRIRNKGVPVLNGHGKGDLYVEVRVQIPSKLSKRQKELLQELEITAKVDNQPMMRSLLGKVKDMFG
jgi:molecular chaperone DnaJ